ncbi:Hypothetical Protein FCC1311_000652 [Hondaea fermentalgiana]|uniref:Uncharacterized protein n=1 Tax=Hondaea fermentalgiana TaxID=2315210 RepID=A0A2R5FZZ9_9STRA|nr:Hypothetical Protein FCC1311_000652 [Hondaea fermentalgiana]|eukprot:GBG23845.1 Hypothetical Protein FCC1311_000652 [Hondaea fermentalgiana]
MKCFAAALALAVLAVTAEAHDAPKGHWSAAIPNFERVNAHGRRLSEACLAKGRALDEVCPLDPETTEGPYVWDEAPIRENITEDKLGVPFEIELTVVNSTTCEEIEGAAVEFWHCDADGIYSHFYEQSTNTGTATDNSTFLRGIQYTNASGVVKISTVFPGWYEGRVTHIHVRVHFNITETDGGESYTGGTVSHVGQLFFPDEERETIHSTWYYENNTATVMTLAEDSIYSNQDGDYGLMNLTALYAGEDITEGVFGTVTVGVESFETDETSDGGSTGGGSGGPSGGDMGGPGGNFSGGPGDGSFPGDNTTPQPTTSSGTGSPTMWPTNAPSSASSVQASFISAFVALMLVR